MDADNEETKKLNELTAKLTTEFRKHALNLGWSLDVVSQMSVVWDDNGFGFDYPPTLEEKIDNLEYGEVGSSPSRAMLNFKNIVLPQLVEEFSNNMFDALDGDEPF